MYEVQYSVSGDICAPWIVVEVGDLDIDNFVISDEQAAKSLQSRRLF
jgi:hypothetical protein